MGEADLYSLFMVLWRGQGKAYLFNIFTRFRTIASYPVQYMLI